MGRSVGHKTNTRLNKNIQFTAANKFLKEVIDEAVTNLRRQGIPWLYDPIGDEKLGLPSYSKFWYNIFCFIILKILVLSVPVRIIMVKIRSSVLYLELTMVITIC